MYVQERQQQDAENDRRTFLQTSLAALLLAGAPASAAETTRTSKAVFAQNLPDVALDGWKVTATEIVFPPGVASPPHRHPGFVLGYVLEGEFRFQVAGEPETVLQTGQMFYEQPGARHIVAASASPAKPARILAMVFAESGKPLVEPA